MQAFAIHRIAIYNTYRTYPVQTFGHAGTNLGHVATNRGHAGTNLGHAAGRDLLSCGQAQPTRDARESAGMFVRQEELVRLILQEPFSSLLAERMKPWRRRWRSNPSGKCSQERLTRGTVTSTMCRAAHPSGCARCGAGAGCSAIKYQSLMVCKGGSCAYGIAYGRP